VFQSYWWSRPWAFAIALTRGVFGCSFQFGCLVLLILVPLILPGLLAILIQAAASRYSELEADRFAVDLGYGPALAGALAGLDVGRKSEERGGVFSSHPPTRRRLGAIESRMGNALPESPFGR
jgi:Zn-dependent protease with chaperone function